MLKYLISLAAVAALAQPCCAATAASDGDSTLGWIKANTADIQTNAAAFAVSNTESLNASCGTSKRLYNVLLGASSTTGDITSLKVAVDTNFDGTDDYLFQPSRPISGVCANGTISCDPGTWNNCTFYEWAAPNGSLQLTPTSLSQLGGCFCVNKSCGAGLALHNMEYVLGKVGEGITGVMRPAFSNYLFNKTTYDGPYMEVFAQSSAPCSASVGVAPSSFSNYKSNPNSLSADGAAKQNDPNSYYSLVTNVDTGEGGNTRETCNIERSVDLTFLSVSDIIAETGTAGTTCWSPFAVTDTTASTGPLTLHFHAGQGLNGGQCSYKRTYDVKRTDRIVGGKITTFGVDDGALIAFNGTTYYSNSVSGDTYGRYSYINDITSKNLLNIPAATLATNPLAFEIKYWIYGSGGGDIDWDLYLNPDEITESTSDSCSRYASNNKCNLWEESIDGVQTMKLGFSTGLAPLPSCRTLQGHMSIYNECKPWWKKTRTYQCSSSSGSFDYSEAITRASFVNTHTTASGNTVTYSDQSRDSSGNLVTTTDSAIINTEGLDGASDCSLTCKVQKIEERTDVGIGPNTSMVTAGSTNSSSTIVKTYYRSCGDDGTCPVGDGEVLVKDCACTSNFAEAVTSLQAAQNAAKDKTCTSGALR